MAGAGANSPDPLNPRDGITACPALGCTLIHYSWWPYPSSSRFTAVVPTLVVHMIKVLTEQLWVTIGQLLRATHCGQC